jgi:hypothetical protein
MHGAAGVSPEAFSARSGRTVLVKLLFLGRASLHFNGLGFGASRYVLVLPQPLRLEALEPPRSSTALLRLQEISRQLGTAGVQRCCCLLSIRSFCHRKASRFAFS